MIELFYADTPNGKKISIMLEEINYPYKVTLLNLKKGDQFNPKFRSISPFSKIPVITDHENNISIFESGAILIYLAEKSGKFYDKDNRISINQWLIGQVAYVGPLLGQHHQFHHYTPGKSKCVYGSEGAYYGLVGQCFTIKSGVFTYKACPYGNATQSEIRKKTKEWDAGLHEILVVQWEGLGVDYSGTPLMNFGGSDIFGDTPPSPPLRVSCR